MTEKLYRVEFTEIELEYFYDCVGDDIFFSQFYDDLGEDRTIELKKKLENILPREEL